jgi:hypothetical protein
MKDLVHQQKLETQGSLLRPILDAATRAKNNPNELIFVFSSTSVVVESLRKSDPPFKGSYR